MWVHGPSAVAGAALGRAQSLFAPAPASIAEPETPLGEDISMVSGEDGSGAASRAAGDATGDSRRQLRHTARTDAVLRREVGTAAQTAMTGHRRIGTHGTAVAAVPEEFAPWLQIPAAHTAALKALRRHVSTVEQMVQSASSASASSAERVARVSYTRPSSP